MNDFLCVLYSLSKSQLSVFVSAFYTNHCGLFLLVLALQSIECVAEDKKHTVIRFLFVAKIFSDTENVRKYFT